MALRCAPGSRLGVYVIGGPTSKVHKIEAPKVPIVIYHSIADEHRHLWSFMSLPIRLFERQLLYLKRKAFQTVTLYEVYEYLKFGKSLPNLRYS